MDPTDRAIKGSTVYTSKIQYLYVKWFQNGSSKQVTEDMNPPRYIWLSSMSPYDVTRGQWINSCL